MTARNLLAIKKLPAFKAWLDANSIENRDEIEVPEELSLELNKKLTKVKSCPSSQTPSPQKS